MFVHPLPGDVLNHLLRRAFSEGKALLILNVDGSQVAQCVSPHGWAEVIEDRPDRQAEAG
jgi:hypothetical protein